MTPKRHPPQPPAAANRVIHFGQFLRWHRVNAGQTTDAFARAVGLTARRVIAIEAMAEPAVQHTTMVAVARQMDLSMDELDHAWRTTPVPVTGRKAGPSTDAARRFTAACGAVGTTPTEGLRRLRLWVIEQPADVQRAALSHRARESRVGDPQVSEPQANEPRFTAAVDHLQDPASATADRLAARAQRQAAGGKKPGPKGPASPTGPASPPSPAGRPGPSPARSPGPAAKAGSRRR